MSLAREARLLEAARNPRPAQLAASFDAFRVLSSGKAQRLEISAASIEDAADQAAAWCAHKDTFAIRETPALGGNAVVHFYTMKRKSRARYVHQDHVTRAVHDLYGEELFAVQMAAFEPVEPWRCTRDSDVVDILGVDRSVVNGRPA